MRQSKAPEPAKGEVLVEIVSLEGIWEERVRGGLLCVSNMSGGYES